MLSFAVALLVPFVGKLAARAIVGTVIATLVAAPFVYTYRQGYSAGKEYCEAKHRAALAEEQKRLDEFVKEVQAETVETEDNDAAAVQREETAARDVYEAIERGGSDAQCIDADSMRAIAAGGSGAGSTHSAAAGARAARSK